MRLTASEQRVLISMELQNEYSISTHPKGFCPEPLSLSRTVGRFWNSSLQTQERNEKLFSTQQTQLYC